jgi:hypothetical protein
LLIVNSLVFYKAQLSNPEFLTFSQLFIAGVMGLKIHVFNLQMLTRTEFENPKKAIFWFTLIGPLYDHVWRSIADIEK